MIRFRSCFMFYNMWLDFSSNSAARRNNRSDVLTIGKFSINYYRCKVLCLWRVCDEVKFKVSVWIDRSWTVWRWFWWLVRKNERQQKLIKVGEGKGGGCGRFLDFYKFPYWFFLSLSCPSVFSIWLQT